MKTKSLFAALMAVVGSCFLNEAASAQENIEVTTIQAQMSKGIQPCYVAEIPGGILKDVQADWTKRLQENVKTRLVVTEDELILTGAVKNEIATDTINIYTLFIEKEDRIIMNVFFEIDSVFFSPKEDKANLSAEKRDNAIRVYIRKFAVEQYQLSAARDLEAEQKILEELQDEYDKLGKENENLSKDNSSLENDIEKTERSITDLDREIELKDQELLTHRTSMLSLTSDEARETAKDKDKELDKEKKKLEKERTGYKNDISDMKAEIEKNTKTIEDNNKLLEDKQSEIDLQVQEVEKAQEFLDGIK